MKNKTNFPPGWDEARVQRVLQHYDSLTEEEAVAEDEAAFEDSFNTRLDLAARWLDITAYPRRR